MYNKDLTTFGSYYAGRAGRNLGGRTEPSKRLSEAHKDIITKLNYSKKEDANLKKISEDLNNLYYPEHGAGDLDDITSQNIAAIYNYLKSLAKESTLRAANTKNNINLSEQNTYLEKAISIESTIEGYAEKSSQTGIKAVHTLNKILEEFEKIYKSLGSSVSKNIIEDTEKNLISLEDWYIKNKKYADSLAEEYSTLYGAGNSASEGTKIKTKFFTTSTSDKDKIKFVKELIQLRNQLISTSRPTKSESGLMAEAAVQYVILIESGLITECTKLGLEELQKIFGTKDTKNNSAISGARRTSKNDLLNIDLYMERKDFDAYDRQYKLPRGVSADGFHIDVHYQPFSQREIKADVMFSVGGELEGGSVKNWNDFFYIKPKDSYNLKNNPSLGSTDILYALLREAGEKLTDDYIYAAQDNQLIPSSGGQLAVQRAHRLAKLCLITDVATGLSQNSFSADALIINNRKAKKFHVFSLQKLIIDYISKNSEKAVKSSLFQVEGYDDDKISNYGWDIIENFLNSKKKDTINGSSNKQKITNQSRIYKACMYSYLHSTKVQLLFNYTQAMNTSSFVNNLT